MSEDFKYEHDTKGAIKRKRVVALDAFVERCAEMNFVAFVVSVVHLVLRVAVRYGWIKWNSEIVIALALLWVVALGVSLVMTVRLIARVMKCVFRDGKEIGWSNVVFAAVFGVGTWVISVGVILEILYSLYMIINL